VPKRISDRCFSIGDESLRSLDTSRIAQAVRSTGMNRGMSLGLTRVLCGAFLLSLLAVSSAVAAPGWLAPTNFVEETGSIGHLRIAVDGQGDAMAVWQSEDGKLEGGASSYEARTAFRPAGGAWQAPERLSLGGQSADEANVAFDAHGDAFAVWEAYSSSVPEGDAHFSIQAAFRPAGGAWQTPVKLSPVEAPGSVHPSLAVDVQGDAIVTWNRAEGPGGGSVQEAFRPAGGAWQAPVDVTQGNAWGDYSQAAFDKQGDALAMWQDPLQSAFMPAGGTWQPPSIVGSELVARPGSDFAVDGRGDAVVVWDSWTEGFLSHRVVQAAFRPAGGEWQAPVDLSEEDPLEEPYEPRVAIDEQGDAVVVWSSGYGESGGVMSAFKPSGDAWQVPVELSPPGTGGYPQVAFDGHGDAIAVWGDSVTVQSALKPAGGNWQSSADLAGEGSGNTYDSPQVAFDGLGDALVVWGNDRNIIRGSAYVVAGPALNNVAIPAEGTVGQPLTFSVSPFDVWSIPVETSWSFGDGASSSGTSVTHTYTATGTYEVTLHTADTLGNVTNTSGKVTIAPAPATTTPSPSAPSFGLPAPEAPTIGAASQSVSTWRESGKAPVGTTLSVSLNEQATVRFSFLQGVSGRIVSHRCVGKPSKRVKRGVCIRTVEVGTVAFTGHPGENNVAFQGLISRSDVLKPGRYKIVVTATNSAGISKPRFLYFTIVK
jgi:PKD domain